MPGSRVGSQIAKNARVAKRLDALMARLSKTEFRKAALRIGTKMLGIAKSKIRRQTGTARKALGRKVKQYRDGKATVVIVGMRAGRRHPKTGQSPSRYGYKIEKIDPFLTPAFRQGQRMVKPEVKKSLQAAKRAFKAKAK